MNRKPEQYLLWVVGAGILGFAVAAVCAGLLRLPRPVYLVVYAGLTSVFLYRYAVWSGFDFRIAVRHHWLLGMLGAALFGTFVVRNVLSQPASPHSVGVALAFDLLWLGVIYGALDALLLSVMPIHAVWRAFSTISQVNTWPARLAVGMVALIASLSVTTLYHVGYPEYRGSAVISPDIGNGTMSVAYLATSNPISSVASHIAMHVAAVLHGPETTAQLPPHY
jgi:hypothetical protein